VGCYRVGRDHNAAINIRENAIHAYLKHRWHPNFAPKPKPKAAAAAAPARKRSSARNRSNSKPNSAKRVKETTAAPAPATTKRPAESADVSATASNKRFAAQVPTPVKQ